MVALSQHYMYYNFRRIHQTIKVTPAMAAGITDHIGSLEEIAGIVKHHEPKKRGQHEKKISD